MTTVLLLTAAYGEGHNAAARGLQTAFIELGVEAEIVDLFAQSHPRFYDQSRRAYLAVINRAPRIWGAAYSFIDRVPAVTRWLTSLPHMRRNLASLLDEKRPRTVISVYPAYSYFMTRLYGDIAKRSPFYTVVTDSITINSVWYRCSSDLFFVPNEQTAHVMRQAGVPDDKLRTFGFPVQPRFARNRPVRPSPQGAESPRVLFMINAGMEGCVEMIERLLELPSLHLTVTVGRDEALRGRIECVAKGRAIAIHGWTDQMPELLMTHHILIGKAGGAAVQEAIAACTPMLITSVVPGQEEGNARLLVENGCAALCYDPDALAAQLQALFADDAREWCRWEQAVRQLSRPDAAITIARYVLQRGEN